MSSPVLSFGGGVEVACVVSRRGFSARAVRERLAAAAAAAAADDALATPPRPTTLWIDQCLRFVQAARASRGVTPLAACDCGADDAADAVAAAGDWIGVAHERAFGNAAAAQRRRTYYEHEAVHVDTWARQHVAAAAGDGARAPPATHEVVAGACKAYVDVDVYRATNAHFDAPLALAALQRAVERQLGAARTPAGGVRWLCAAAHGAHKWSYHLVAENLRAEHCRVWHALLLAALRASPALAQLLCVRGPAAGDGYRCAVDVGVYAHKHLFRVCGSAKLDDPARALRVVRNDTASSSSSSSPLDVDTLRRSLVTACFAPDTVDVPATPEELSLLPSRTRSPATTTAAGGGGAVPPEIAALAAALDVHGARVTGTDFRAADASLLVRCGDTCACAIKGGEHKTSTIYYKVDVRRGRYRQMCHSPHCLGRATAWRALNARADALAHAYVQRTDRQPLGRALARLLLPPPSRKRARDDAVMAAL